ATPLPTLSKTQSTPRPAPSTPTVIPTEIPPTAPAKKTGGPWLFLVGLVGFLGAVTALTLMFFEERPFAFSTRPAPPLPDPPQDQLNPESATDPAPDTAPDTEKIGITADELTKPLLMAGSYLQLSQPVALLAEPQLDQDGGNTLGQLPAGTIVQILTRQDKAGEQGIWWVKLKICSDLAVTPPASTSLTSGTEGWVTDAELASIASAATELDCAPE
ncbi:SH3 domain-containing protein, partial [Leptolyngbya cf. ectocarpi LEGE 11479]